VLDGAAALRAVVAVVPFRLRDHGLSVGLSNPERGSVQRLNRLDLGRMDASLHSTGLVVDRRRFGARIRCPRQRLLD